VRAIAQTTAPAGRSDRPQHGGTALPDSVRLPENTTGRLHRTAARRHDETAPPGPCGENWFEWEERPGPEPTSSATGGNDQTFIQVCDVERTQA
jgi:hypothetical protein